MGLMRFRDFKCELLMSHCGLLSQKEIKSSPLTKRCQKIYNHLQYEIPSSRLCRNERGMTGNFGIIRNKG